MDVLATQMVNGMALGSVYALVAVGYALVFGVINVMNLAHGDIFIFSIYIMLFLLALLTPNLFLGIVIVALVAGLLGMTMERIAIRPVAKHSFFAPFITTMAVSMILTQSIIILFGPGSKLVPSLMNMEPHRWGPVVFTNAQVLALVAGLLIMGFLALLITRTKLGRAVRAVAENRDMAATLGINVGMVFAFTIGLGSALGGVAGLIIGQTYGFISPAMGLNFSVKGLISVIIGGVTSMPGAILAGYLIGLVEILGAAYISSAYRDLFAFGLLLVILLVRPQGILGNKS